MRASKIAMTALLLAPTCLRAEELQFGVRSNASWTDNVFGTPEDFERAGEEEDAVDDYSLRLSPFVAVKDPDGELTWDLRYQPSYEAYLDQSELSGFDQAVAAGLEWRFADRWNFSVQQGFVLNQNSVRFNEGAAPGEEVTLGFREQEVRHNRTTALLSHSLTPRDTLALTAEYSNFTYPDTDRADRSIPSTALAYDHRFSERTSAGFRVSWTQQSNEGALTEDETNFYNVSGTLRHSFSQTFRIEAAVGPTLVDSNPPDTFELNQFPLVGRDVIIVVDGVPVRGRLPYAIDANTCAEDPHPDIGRVAPLDFGGPCEIAGDPTTFLDDAERAILREFSAVIPTIDEQGRPVDSTDDTGTDLNFFARLVLTKDWERWRGSLGYQRSNSETARLGSSSVADSVWGTLTWLPGELWTLTLTASAGLQQQASEQAVPIAFEVANVDPPPGVTVGPGLQIAQVQSLIVSTDTNDLEYWTQLVSLRATRRLTRRASAFAAATWFSQQQEVGANVDETTRWQDLTISVGLEWQFDPIRF